jgi:hypothetical protein
MAPYTTRATFDPRNDFKPITAVGTSPFIVTVAAEIPAHTLAEFITHVKTEPGKMTYAKWLTLIPRAASSAPSARNVMSGFSANRARSQSRSPASGYGRRPPTL